jgi:hypothetical protein
MLPRLPLRYVHPVCVFHFIFPSFWHRKAMNLLRTFVLQLVMENIVSRTELQWFKFSILCLTHFLLGPNMVFGRKKQCGLGEWHLQAFVWPRAAVPSAETLAAILPSGSEDKGNAPLPAFSVDLQDNVSPVSVVAQIKPQDTLKDRSETSLSQSPEMGQWHCSNFWRQNKNSSLNQLKPLSCLPYAFSHHL